MDLEKYALIKISLIALGFSLMYIGGLIDKKERKYPNLIVFLTSLIGIGVAFMNERLLIALILCVAFHGVGVVDTISLKLMKPGDWKMFATLVLYLPFENVKIFMLFAVILLIMAVITKLKTLKKLDLKHIKESMKAEKDALTTMVYLREHLNPSKEVLDLFKEETVPMTYIFFISFAITQLFCI